MEFTERKRIISLISQSYSCINCGERFHLSALQIIDDMPEAIGVRYSCPKCTLRHYTTFYEGFGNPDYVPGVNPNTAMLVKKPKFTTDLGPDDPYFGSPISADDVLEVRRWVQGLTCKRITS